MQSIEITNFKSHQHTLVNFNPKLNAILGLNGVGKTNLLDAIYYSCLGKSYFSSGDRSVIRHKTKFFRIHSAFQKGNYVENFVAKVIPGKKKDLEIDGKIIQKLSDHIGRFPCIIIAPLDIQLLLEGSAERRKFLNNTLIQHDEQYILHSIKYNRLLKQRNALLKSFHDKRYFDDILLNSLSAGMFESADYIFESRKNLIESISPLFSDLYNEISGRKEKCEIVFKSHLSGENLKFLFKENTEKDRILARTTCGVHKDDLQFLMNKAAIKPYGSQGQLKSFVLALKLAQYHYLKEKLQIKPLLLLDDLFDKLDALRVKNLLAILHKDDYGQVFITDKDKNIISELLEQISEDYTIFALNEDTPEYSEEE